MSYVAPLRGCWPNRALKWPADGMAELERMGHCLPERSMHFKSTLHGVVDSMLEHMFQKSRE